MTVIVSACSESGLTVSKAQAEDNVPVEEGKGPFSVTTAGQVYKHTIENCALGRDYQRR